MSRGALVLIASLVLRCLLVSTAVAETATILPGSLAKLDIKDAEIVPTRSVPNGTLTIAQHFALDPSWLDPQDHIVALTQQHYDYLVHDAMVKTMPQGLLTYSLAEHAEATTDFTKVAFRLRQGLTFHDGQALTTAGPLRGLLAVSPGRGARGDRAQWRGTQRPQAAIRLPFPPALSFCHATLLRPGTRADRGCRGTPGGLLSLLTSQPLAPDAQ